MKKVLVPVLCFCFIVSLSSCASMFGLLLGDYRVKVAKNTHTDLETNITFTIENYYYGKYEPIDQHKEYQRYVFTHYTCPDETHWIQVTIRAQNPGEEKGVDLNKISLTTTNGIVCMPIRVRSYTKAVTQAPYPFYVPAVSNDRIALWFIVNNDDTPSKLNLFGTDCDMAGI